MKSNIIYIKAIYNNNSNDIDIIRTQKLTSYEENFSTSKTLFEILRVELSCRDLQTSY